jgi:hypothetical protein
MVSAGTILAACSIATTPVGTLPAQVLTDISGALKQLAILVPALLAIKLPSLTTAWGTALLSDITAAQGFMATISASTVVTDGGTVLATVEGYLNAVLAALETLTLPSPYSLIVAAANIIAVEVESYLATLLPAPAPTPAAARARKRSYGMSLEAARKVLKIAP